eukprot:6750989-Alexandrium_andersonii.AAC.1
MDGSGLTGVSPGRPRVKRGATRTLRHSPPGAKTDCCARPRCNERRMQARMRAKRQTQRSCAP